MEIFLSRPKGTIKVELRGQTWYYPVESEPLRMKEEKKTTHQGPGRLGTLVAGWTSKDPSFPITIGCEYIENLSSLFNDFALFAFYYFFSHCVSLSQIYLLA